MSSQQYIKVKEQIDELLQLPIYSFSQQQKESLLLPIMTDLHELHRQSCEQYANIFSASHTHSFERLSDIHYIAVRLFKHLELMSIDPEQVFKTLHSSGTTSQQAASIYLDRDTSSRQSKSLVKILQQSIGKQRLPMLIVDTPKVLKDKSLFSARGAGIQGVSFFGRDHTYALNDDMQPNWAEIEQFCDKYQGQPVLIFGFTFMLWLYFIQPLQQQSKTLDLEHGIVIHSGGWKKLEQQKIDNHTFKASFKQVANIAKVVNFYGMAEQVGSVFVECSQGHLHAPLAADVIIRDPTSLLPCANGEVGIIQVLSVLPTSYPGHSLLTEDLGRVLGVDDCQCGQKGKYFDVIGRLPKTEVRGCSDTHQGAG